MRANRARCPVCHYCQKLCVDGTLHTHHLYSGKERLPDCEGSRKPPTYAGPQRIVIAGDWHGNTEWAVNVIALAAKALASEPDPLILHLGDFGVWPGERGAAYITAVREALRAHGPRLRFIDGNHEDFTQLHSFLSYDYFATLAWLPRGSRWQWHGREWLAVGGGVSLDKAGRTEGISWWPEEEVTEHEAESIRRSRDGVKGGVLLAHDCPSGVCHTFPPPPSWWDLRDLARSDAHQERLHKIVMNVQPTHIIHGHLHRAYQRVCDFGYGPVEVTGLDCDGSGSPNWLVLDTVTMTWEAP